jgi:hypothetical protein
MWSEFDSRRPDQNDMNEKLEQIQVPDEALEKEQIEPAFLKVPEKVKKDVDTKLWDKMQEEDGLGVPQTGRAD